MDSDRMIRLLEEIRDLQQRLLDSHHEARRNQEAAIEAQRLAIARGRKLQFALGAVIVAVLVVVLLLMKYVLATFA